LDSGGYQILRARAKGQHQRADYSVAALARIYEAARLGKDDYAISLDIPPIWRRALERAAQVPNGVDASTTFS
ncbi:MAG: hypothetical protein JW839_00435, partial [Candidatus Lokiarchaeota archaeon]|nr:hypothetical protein [Candidatus Lokiarchaeota archaeon]